MTFNINGKLKFAAVAVPVAFIAAILLSLWSTGKVKDLGNIEVGIHEIAIGFLVLRRHEKDFLARNDLKYTERFNKHVDLVNRQIDDLIDEMHAMGLANISANAKALEAILKEYRQTFNALADVRTRIGLDHKSGLYGALRDSVHQVEDIFKRLKNDKLLKDLLILRRSEKDFMLRRLLKYVDKFTADYQVFKADIQSAIPDAEVKERALNFLNAYQRDFLALITGYKEMGLTHKKGREGEMRTTVHRTETELEGLEKSLHNAVEAAIKRQKWTIFGVLSLFAAVIAIGLWLLARNIKQALAGLAGGFHKLVDSNDVSTRLQVKKQDEIGEIATLFNRYMEHINQGMEVDNRFIDATAALVEQVKAGNLGCRMEEDANNSGLNALKPLINDMLKRMATVFKDVQTSLQKMEQGDLSASIEREYHGDFECLKNACNSIAGQFRTIINESGTVLGKLSGGDFQARISNDFRGDFAAIKESANSMAGNLQDVIRETGESLGQLAGGNMDIRISGEFTGDFVEIKNALESTAAQLGEAKARDATETWLKNGQTLLSEQLSGEQDIKLLTENIINFLTPYVEAQVGAFHLVEEKDEQEEPSLKMMATHAYVRRQTGANITKIGEGIVGQAAYEKKMFTIAQAPDDYIRIQSSLGDGTPKEILVTPFLYENTVKGVIELASFTAFTEIQLEFIRQMMPAIAIAVTTAESRTKMQVLLEQSQAQAEELQSQSEEMRIQQEKLQHTNEELQSQSEELQSQQEELRQTNEELGSRTMDLEKEREGIRIKNRQLEKTQQAIQIKADELELASKYKSEFLANMSHELRTPLNSLLILAELLANNKDKNLNEKQVECARTIHASGIDLLALINEILDLSKVEAGKITIHVEEMPLENLIKSLQRKFLHVAEERSVSFDIKTAKNFPPKLHTDIQRLQQILNNLLSNAFKFTEQGGVTLEMRRPAADENLSRSELDPAKAVSISVSDTGIGIPKDKQKLVFEAFQQADGTTSRRFGGTGLGLSITRQLVQLLGGEIQVYSEENKGSRFTVYLPERLSQHTAEDARQTAASAPADDNAPLKENIETAAVAIAEEEIEDDRENLNPGDKSLLIIEDDAEFSHTLANLAREKKFKALIAGDGRHGLQMAEYYRPSAIILDVGLPQMDGWSVMEKLKDNSDTRHIPVHFVSGTDHHADAKKMGAIGYSLKPVSMGDLGNAFDKIEHFIKSMLRDVLIVTDNEQHSRVISEIVGSERVELTVAVTLAEAGRHLHDNECDCIILDVSVEQDAGIELLIQLCKKQTISQTPVIIYSERDLTQQENAALNKCANANDLTVKTVRSSERLLGEATLFLHQVEAQLPKEQQQMLQMEHDKEAILTNRKIILADDDMRNIFALCAILEEKGMEVITGTNGEEALDLLDEHEDIDLVLMDIMMPKMDGYEAMRKIRAQPRFSKLPIIALTAKAMKDDRTKCIEAGANDYLSKPIESNKLISLMRVWLYQ
ncbi:MAG: response regulator [Gammaproteobacteria bacterium]|nr:response regulator [Gammaproteobacteria bacterium]